MNRSPLDRLFALLLAVLFLGSTAGDGLGLDPCPHHAPAPPAEAAAHGAGHHAHHASDAAATPDAPADHSGACTCIGACEAGTGATLPSPPPATIRDEVADRATGAAAPVASVVPRLLPYFLPYGLAPPRHG